MTACSLMEHLCDFSGWMTAILYPTKNGAIDKCIDSLEDAFLLEREDTIAGFVGLKIDRNTFKGTITLT